jgi:hypothetical protein
MSRPRLPTWFLEIAASLTAIAAFAGEEPRVITGSVGHNINDLVVTLLQSMPIGGRYSTDSSATRLLSAAVALTPGGLSVRPEVASPTYCSGATYLVFLRVCQRLRDSGLAALDGAQLGALLIQGQRDGEGIWGRWNANGPGTARLFHELGLGPNFTDFAAARPGDFLKIFWTPEVGRSERGHSVIYLGSEVSGGNDSVRFWSSNNPEGYGEKTVPRSRIAKAIFSRFDNPGNLARMRTLPQTDPYLASLLRVRSSFAEACEKSGCRP